jgi:isochorismate synthase
MALVTDRQRRILRAAEAFALWRDPQASRPTLLASRRAPMLGPVFHTDVAEASFVMCPFSAPEGNRALHFAGDVIDGPDGLSVRSGAEALFEGLPGPFRAPPEDATPPAPVSRDAYEARLARVIEAIRDGQAEKVVISRTVEVPVAGRDLVAAFEALAQAYPPAFVALVSSRITGTWLVATPETLLRTDADTVRTMALAGTQWPENPADLSLVTWPEKIRREQAIVAREIRETFAAAGIEGVQETPARTVQAANLCHLRSDFAAPRPPEPVLAQLLDRLHPTSAVCGMPRAAAQKVITREEGDMRGFYTGYLGPCRVAGETRLYVNLRTARVIGDTAYLHVGGGIVAGSEPALEWQETVEKAKTVGQHLRPEGVQV